MLSRPPVRVVAAAAAVILVVAAFLTFSGGPERRTLTAHFSRAVSVFPGTEVRILGVKVGEVTAVVPEGDAVRVEMTYESEYQVPAGAKAVIVTPTLIADRFIQLTPVYTGGALMADGADIPLADTGTPVELDRIYASLDMLSNALGPNGANRRGSLDTLLAAGAKSLDGEGATANAMIRNMSAAAETFGNSSGDLFGTVEQLNAFTQTLARNDKVVDRFMADLAMASGQLSGERQEIGAALAALASAVGRVRAFVHDNRDAVRGEVEDLTVVLDALVQEKESLSVALEKGPLGAGNLALGFDTKTGSQDARIQVGPNVEDLDGFLCAIVKNAGVPRAPAVCQLLSGLVEPLGLGLPDLGARAGLGSTRVPGEVVPAGNLQQLLGGGR